MKSFTLGIFSLAFGLLPAAAQRPILPDFHADPSARVIDGKIYLYPSHDAAGARNWKQMKDWHVFSSDDMKTWTDHGVAFSLKDISWADEEAWAPDCIERNGKYYFYFPAGGQVGVAVSDSPTGPFKDALGHPLVKKNEAGIRYMIDPHVFIDDDGQAYLYIGGGRQLGVVKLKEDMITRDGPFQILEMPEFYEGVWINKRNGVYYASYPTRPGGRNSQANVMLYSVSKSPMGPFELKGPIIDNKSGNVHGSITEFKGQSYLFYHVAGPSTWERRVCVEPLFYNEDGTIKPISMTPPDTASQTVPVEDVSSGPLLTGFFENLKSGKNQTVVLYGTSLSHTSEYPKALKTYFDKNFGDKVNFINSASSGKHSGWGVANLKKRVLNHNPDLVFIEFSMNDAATKHNISIEKAIENLDLMVKTLRQQNPQVSIVLMTMNTAWDAPSSTPERASLRSRPQLLDYYEAYRKYAKEQSLPLIDHYQNWSRVEKNDEATFKKWIPDGCHPTPEGSLAVTWKAIEAFLEKSRTSSR
ncbi:MAG: family 43 glycosylhydrolase [Luteolibacter sp.]